jgi:hypothetical protein
LLIVEKPHERTPEKREAFVLGELASILVRSSELLN